MGTGRSLPDNEPEEIRKHRISSSFKLREQREDRKQLFSNILSKGANETNRESYIPAQFPQAAMQQLIQYLLPQFGTLITVSTPWYLNSHEAIDTLMAQAENSFVTMHSQLILFKKSYTVARPYTTSETAGVRIDRVLVVEPLPCLKGKTILMRYTYRCLGEYDTYKVDFYFDWIKQQKKSIWAHKDDSKVHGETEKQAYTRQVSQVWMGDLIEFVINIYNIQGLVDLDSISFTLPKIEDTNKIVNYLNKIIKNPPTNVSSPEMESFKQVCILSKQRTCEVELNWSEWYDYKYYTRSDDSRFIHWFSPFLKLASVEFAGVDLTIAKMAYKAFLPGIIPESKKVIGVQIEVVEGQVCEEVKRFGFLIDRGSTVQLREGDTFILYISRN